MPDPSFIVKICGITNEEDARAAVTSGANALGFNFYPKSPRYITPQHARQVSTAVPGPYLRVGVFVNPSERHVLEIAAAVPLDVVQLHGDHCPSSFTPPLRVWRSIAPNTISNDQNVEAYLLDTPSPDFGGSGQTFDWTLAHHHARPIILAGGLDSSNVAQAIRIGQPWGVDACSRLESSPGKKNTTEVQAFIAAAHAAALPTSDTRPRNDHLHVAAGHARPSPPEQPKAAKL